MAGKRRYAWQPKFLQAFAETGNVTLAAQAAGVHRAHAYDVRKRDQAFADAWDDAEQESHDRLEQEAFRRAVYGVEKPVTVAGQREVIREYSDALVIFLLKARRPERYRDNHRVEHTGADGQPIQVVSAFHASRDPAAVPGDPPAEPAR